MTVLKVANHKSRVKNAGRKKLINTSKKHHFPSNNPVSSYAKRKEGGGTEKVIWEVLEDRMSQWARWPAVKNNNLDLSPESHTV